MGCRDRDRDRDRGSVTAELALALPAVVLLLAVVLTVSAGATAQQRCTDAARTAVRLAAVGEPADVVVAAARQVAGRDVTVNVVSTADGWVQVDVVGAGAGAWFLDGLLPITGKAVAPREEGS